MLPPFQAFMERHSPDVWRFLVASVGPDDAEDCLQETFLNALRLYPGLKHDRNLRSWVLTIAHWKAMDTHRAKAKGPRPVEEVPDRPAPQSADGDPELWKAVRALPPKQRIAVAYRFTNDLTYKDIAKVMSSTEEAARRNVHEGIKKLREVVK